jgi:hypothetical protein
MTVNASVPPPAQSDPSRSSSTAQLIVWLGTQLAVLTIAAARLPLAARYPQPAEQLTPNLLLSAQLIMASLLFPWMLRGARCIAQILAAALPFQLASAYLAGTSAREVAGAVAYVDSFVIVLGLWSPVLRSSLTQSLGIALASCVTLGGGMLRYLRVEYSGGSSASVPHTWETVTPLPSTLQALAGQTPAGGWVVIGVLAIAAITIRLTGRRQHPADGEKTPKNASFFA